MTRRPQRLRDRIAFFIVTAGLLSLLASEVDLTAAANGASGTSVSRALRGAVTIDLDGKRPGQHTNAGRGRFTISGAISDHGRFVDRPGFIVVRVLHGARGTIWVTVGAPEPGSRCQCNWRIAEGTGAYAGLHGRGRESGVYSRTIDIRMNGVVSQ